MASEGESKKAELFPLTRWTLVQRTLESGADDAVSELCSLYWSPVYFFIRKRGKNSHDAEDSTQAFFAQLLEKKQFQRAAKNPDAGRLRSYLLKSVQNFLIVEHRKEIAQKRGGTAEKLSVDVEGIERQFVAEGGGEISPEEMFDHRWAANVLEQAFAQLESQYQEAKKQDQFDILKLVLSQTADQVPFVEIAARLGLEEGNARVIAFRFRKQFRAMVREVVRDTTSSEADFEEELNHLKKLLGG